MKKYILLPVLFFSIAACNAQPASKAKHLYPPKTVKTSSDVKNLGDRYYANDKELNASVDKVYSTLSNQQRAAQMIMVASSETLGFPYATTVAPMVKNEYAANVLFLKGTKAAFIKQHAQLEKYVIAGLTPLFACDCEPTLLHNKFTGEKKMRPTSNLKTEDDVLSSVDTINNLMDEMGIKVNFAPIVDIAKNKSIINKRSFGNDTAIIRQQANAFVKHTQDDGKAATVKHFPGHGAVIGDTHKQSVFINGKMTELPTFETIINASNPIFVMVGHISVKNNPEGYNTENARPATTSKKIVTDLLRNKMAFSGIITTDAMNMKATNTLGSPDWEAAKAGVDLVLMPADAKNLNEKIAAELSKNSALGKQFEQSVKRIIRLKLLMQQ